MTKTSTFLVSINPSNNAFKLGPIVDKTHQYHVHGIPKVFQPLFYQTACIAAAIYSVTECAVVVRYTV